jgi:hypothetical protein
MFVDCTNALRVFCLLTFCFLYMKFLLYFALELLVSVAFVPTSLVCSQFLDSILLYRYIHSPILF